MPRTRRRFQGVSAACLICVNAAAACAPQCIKPRIRPWRAADNGTDGKRSDGSRRERTGPQAAGQAIGALFLGAVRLGQFARPDAGRHFHFPGLFQSRSGRRRGSRPGALGLWHRGQQPPACAVEPIAWRHRRCRRKAQAVAFRLLRALRPGLCRFVVRSPGARRGGSLAPDRGPRQYRLRLRGLCGSFARGQARWQPRS